MEYITNKQVHELFRNPRPRDAHKGDYGRLLIVAGSKGMAGSAILCARSALRSGVGIVTVSAPDEIIPIIQTAVPEAICVTHVRETVGNFSDKRNDAPLSPDRLAEYDAIAIGPGLGTSSEARDTFFHIIENYGGRMIIDADALNILSETNITFDADTIITPHPGEAARLLSSTPDVIQDRREASASILAERYGCIVVLKGAGTIVATTKPTLKLYINTTGNPGMATGGSGDALTGVIASFAAQGMSPLIAARTGVCIHGLAGDLAAAEFGERGLIAGDLPLAIAKAIKLIGD